MVERYLWKAGLFTESTEKQIIKNEKQEGIIKIKLEIEWDGMIPVECLEQGVEEIVKRMKARFYGN